LCGLRIAIVQAAEVALALDGVLIALLLDLLLIRGLREEIAINASELRREKLI